MHDESMEVKPDATSTEDFQKQVATDATVTTRFQDRRFSGGDVREVLRQLYYYIQVDLGITPERWEGLVDHYVKKHTTASRSPTEIRSAIKKNFLRAKQMTQVMFIRALKILPIIRIRIGVTLVFANKRATDHGIWINLNDVEALTGLDETIGDVQAPVRYMSTLSGRTDLDNPLIQQEGDHDLLEKLRKLSGEEPQSPTEQ